MKSFGKIIEIITNGKHPPCLFLHTVKSAKYRITQRDVWGIQHIAERKAVEAGSQETKQIVAPSQLSGRANAAPAICEPSWKMGNYSWFCILEVSAELPFPILAVPK